jgi:hypothetical protein
MKSLTNMNKFEQNFKQILCLNSQFGVNDNLKVT